MMDHGRPIPPNTPPLETPLMRSLLRASFAALVLLVPSEIPAQAPDSYRQGINALKAGDHDLAIACFTAVLKEKPAHLDALIHRGKAYLEKHQLEKALADANAALELDPK